MKIAFAVFLFIHAAAHAVGFLTISGIVESDDVSGEASFLLTGFDPGHPLMRVMAVLWLVPLAGFVAAGVGVLGDASWALPPIIASIAVSSILCLLWIKDTPFGLVANAIVVVALVVPALSERVLP